MPQNSIFFQHCTLKKNGTTYQIETLIPPHLYIHGPSLHLFFIYYINNQFSILDISSGFVWLPCRVITMDTLTSEIGLPISCSVSMNWWWRKQLSRYVRLCLPKGIKHQEICCHQSGANSYHDSSITVFRVQLSPLPLEDFFYGSCQKWCISRWEKYMLFFFWCRFTVSRIARTFGLDKAWNHAAVHCAQHPCCKMRMLVRQSQIYCNISNFPSPQIPFSWKTINGCPKLSHRKSTKNQDNCLSFTSTF